MSKVSIQECHKLAHLARLSLSQDEAEQFAAQLAEVLTYIETLQEVDITDVPEYMAAEISGSSLRTDEVGSMLSREQILASVPEKRDSLVVVPKFLED